MMNVGIQMVLATYGWQGMSDDQAWDEEIRLARREFAAFRQTMEESRERFDESAAMILEALRTGWMEGNGKYYKQPRVELRPRPKYSFDGRIYAVAASDDSVEACARLGARMVM